MSKPNFNKPIVDMKKYRDFKVKISQIPAMDVAFESMTISEYELLVATIYRLNELIEVHNNYTEKIDEILNWVLNEGIGLAVLDQLNIWLNDGTLENLINETLLNMKLDKSEFEEYKLFINQTLQDLEQNIQSIIDGEIIRIDGELEDLETNKADKTYVDGELDNKANLTDFNEHVNELDIHRTIKILENENSLSELNDGEIGFVKEVRKYKTIFNYDFEEINNVIIKDKTFTNKDLIVNGSNMANVTLSNGKNAKKFNESYAVLEENTHFNGIENFILELDFMLSQKASEVETMVSTFRDENKVIAGFYINTIFNSLQIRFGDGGVSNENRVITTIPITLNTNLKLKIYYSKDFVTGELINLDTGSVLDSKTVSTTTPTFTFAFDSLVNVPLILGATKNASGEVIQNFNGTISKLVVKAEVDEL